MFGRGLSLSSWADSRVRVWLQANNANTVFNLDHWCKHSLACWMVSGTKARIFWDSGFPHLTVIHNLTVLSRSAPSVDVLDFQRAQSGSLRIRLKDNFLDRNVGSVFQFPRVSIFPPLHSVENDNGKSQNTQNYLSAII